MILPVLALLPAIYLMHYIYKSDQIEKEPIGLLAKIFLFGVVSTIPSIIIGLILERVLGILFDPGTGLYNVIDMFLAVALVEEFWKRWAARRAWDHPAFNYRFDAVVYCVSAALGFAALENILYVMTGGVTVAVLRALLAVPSHAIDGVIMGIFFGEAKIRETMGDRRGQNVYWKLSLIVPMLAHGFYDFCLVSESELMGVLFVVFVIMIDLWAVKYIKTASASDERI